MKMDSLKFGLLMLLAGPQFSAAATWYVRNDGGTRSQCTGKTDAAYSGAGTAQPCAFNDYRYLYSDGTYNNKAWVIAGGDTVILHGGPWRVGQVGPGSGDSFGNDQGDPFGAYNPPIPAGTAGQHTRILGENYGNCTAKTQLFGGYAVGVVLNLTATRYLDVQCLELTDHAQCTRYGTPAYPAYCSSSYPLDDYAGTGIVTDSNTADVLLQDMDIHGLTSRAIIGPIGGTVTINRVRMAYNAAAGWDFDDGVNTPSHNGQINASYLTVEWNGCNEEYPITHAFPAISCYDASSAGYGDGVGTADTTLNFSCDHCLFRYNTQDGLDLLHVHGSTISITRSSSYANMGQQYKLGPMTSTIFQNNLALTNCNRMSAAISGAPSTYNQYLSNYCRAAGDGIAANLTPGGALTFQNNTFLGYSATMFDLGCGSTDCSASSIVFENNIVMGYSNPAYNAAQLPGLFYFDGALSAANFTARDHNMLFNVRNSGCPSTGYGESCADPRFTGEPSAIVDETTLDNFNYSLSTGSPARDAGLTLPAVTTDINGIARPQGPAYDLGAQEYQPGSTKTPDRPKIMKFR
jgi:hypothetical protein